MPLLAHTGTTSYQTVHIHITPGVYMGPFFPLPKTYLVSGCVFRQEYELSVFDISSLLEITFYDVTTRREFVGKVVVPLLFIKNGRQAWFQLKNASLSAKAKGETRSLQWSR